MKTAGLLFLTLANLVACVTVEQIAPPSPAATQATAEDAGVDAGSDDGVVWQDGGVPGVEDASPPKPDVDTSKPPPPTCPGATTPPNSSAKCVPGFSEDGGKLDDSVYCPASCGGGSSFVCPIQSNASPTGKTCYTRQGTTTDLGYTYVCCID